jgi:hypothetical protein
VDVSLLIKNRLSELALDQKDLAAAVQVTESYISQLLARKKAPPAPGRTDLYERIGHYLSLPTGELSKLADLQRQAEFKKKVADPPAPLFKDCRDLIPRKCQPECLEEVRQIFQKEPFGEFERLLTQKILDVAQGVGREELRSETWLKSIARVNGHSFEQMRVAVLEFLDTPPGTGASDVFHIAINGCVSFLDAVIESWRVDVKTFRMDIVLNRRLASGGAKRFEFMETTEERTTPAVEPGFESFLRDKSLSGDASEEEIEFLKTLKFKGRQPSPLYYYRELQNLRDPLHFPTA